MPSQRSAHTTGQARARAGHRAKQAQASAHNGSSSSTMWPSAAAHSAPSHSASSNGSEIGHAARTMGSSAESMGTLSAGRRGGCSLAAAELTSSSQRGACWGGICDAATARLQNMAPMRRAVERCGDCAPGRLCVHHHACATQRDAALAAEIGAAWAVFVTR
jgi:hypothetical protein